MKPIQKAMIYAFFTWSLSALGNPLMAAEPDYAKILKSVAGEIEKLKGEYPQLADFSADKNVDLQRLVIDYGFHTHAPDSIGGWTSGVPHPNDDGIWFYIDFHDPDSQAQIHNQPILNTLTPIGKKIAFMLDLEGGKTRPVVGRIWSIVQWHADRANETWNTSLASGKGFQFKYNHADLIEVSLDVKGLLHLQWHTLRLADENGSARLLRQQNLSEYDRHVSDIWLTREEIERFKKTILENGILQVPTSLPESDPRTYASAFRSTLEVVFDENKKISWTGNSAVPGSLMKTVNRLVALAQEIRKSRTGE